MSACEHDYKYGGVHYKVGRQCPGSSASNVHYYDHYFCRKCLHHVWEQLPHTTDTYEPIAFDARPRPNEKS